MAEQGSIKSMNSLLGYPEDAKLLLINSDDAGMCHSVNLGIIEAFAGGMVQSCTVMVPAPGFEDFIALKKQHPQVRCGIHLTVTSEWDTYRWGSVAPAEKVPSLLDAEGKFYRSEHDYFRLADPREVEIEFRAQIEKAFSAGLEPTHIDSHMGAYHWDEEIFQRAKGLAQEFGLTMRIGFQPRRELLRAQGWAIVDRLWFDTYEVPLDQRETFYLDFLRQLEPGVTELVIHCAAETDELRSICGPTAAHRGFDLRFFSDPQTKVLLTELNIECISYKTMHDLHKRTFIKD